MKRQLRTSIPLLAAFVFVAVGVLAGVGGYTFWYAKGYSYLSDDPLACANCHIMNDNLHSWSVSSHRDVSCNGCHLPHQPILKYLAKMENGFRHSFAFTFEDVQVIHIKPLSMAIVQDNCRECHEATVTFIAAGAAGTTRSCTRCHQGAGHVF